MELIEAVARALAKSHGLDFDEVCGVDADPDNGYCDSGTCIAAGYEDHDAAYARACYLSDATAAIAAMQAHMVPVGWQPIETAPKGEVIIGLRDPSHTGRQPAFIGEFYDLRENALLDQWSGRWAVCTHWQPLPTPPAFGEPK